jgi:hypothetical protein
MKRKYDYLSSIVLHLGKEGGLLRLLEGESSEGSQRIEG